MVSDGPEQPRPGRSHRLRRLAVHMHKQDLVRAASAMAFHAFFGLLPLLALTGLLAHHLALRGDRFLAPLAMLAPGPVARLADTEFMRLAEGSGTVLAPLGAVGFLWLASGGISTAMVTFERLFDAAPRRWWARRAIALAFVLAALTVLVISTAAALAGVWLGGLAARVLGVLVPLAGLWLLAASFFRLATRRAPGRRRRGFRGALLTVSLWLAVSGAFSAYVTRIARYSKFYGSLAAVVVLLTWLWLMCFALLLGGAANAALELRDAERSGHPHDARHPATGA